MNPTTIPDSEIWPGADRFVAVPPDGDLTGEGGIEPVEMLRGGLEGTDLPFHAMRYRATKEEAQRLMDGEPIWLVYFLPFPVPVALEFADVITETAIDDPTSPPGGLPPTGSG